MGTVSTTFTGDPEKLLQAYNQIVSANLKLKQQMAEGASESRKHHSEIMGFAKEQASSIKSLALSYFPITKGIEAVVSAYEDWNEKMAQSAERAKQLNQEFIKTVQLSGDAARAPEVAAQLGSVKGTSKSDMIALYGGVSGSALDASLERRIGIAKALGKVAPLTEDKNSLGDLAGQLSGFMPGKSPSEVADAAIKLRGLARGQTDTLQSAKVFGHLRTLAASGATDEAGALGLGLEAASQDNPRLVSEITAAVTDPKRRATRDQLHGLTVPQRRATSLFYAASPQERLRMLLENKDAAAGVIPGNATALGTLRPDAIKDLANQMRSSAGAGAEAVQQAAATAQGREVLNEYQRSLRPKVKPDEAQRGEVFNAALDASFAQSNPVVQYVAKPYARLRRLTYRTLGAKEGQTPEESALNMFPDAQKIYNRDTEQIEGSDPTGAGLRRQYQGAISRGADPVDALKQIRAAQREHTEAVREQTEALKNLRRSGPTVSNNNQR